MNEVEANHLHTDGLRYCSEILGEPRETGEATPQPIVNGNGHAQAGNDHPSFLQSARQTDGAKGRFVSRARLIVFAAIVVGLLAGFAIWNRQQTSRAISSIPEANEAFAAGEELIKKRSPCPSVPYFREAAARDPQFGRAFANLAAAQAMCGSLEGIEENIAKALVLDPRSAEAHATDGFLRTFMHWDWDGAERSLRRAVELDPESAMAHHWLGVYLSIRGRFGEAQGEMRRAIDLDPGSPLYLADLCQVFYFAEAFDYAMHYCGRSQALDPDFSFTNWYLRDIYVALGDEKTAAGYEIKMQYDGMSESPKTIERETLEREGLQAYWRHKLDKQLKEWNDNQVKPENRRGHRAEMGSLYARLGDKENALRWLDEAISIEDGPRAFFLPYIGVDPIYKFLRDDPRFEGILQKKDLSREPGR